MDLLLSMHFGSGMTFGESRESGLRNFRPSRGVPLRGAEGRPHVLYIIDSLSDAGGAEHSLATIAPHLIKAGLRLDVAHLKPLAPLAPTLRAAGVQVHSLAGAGGRLGWLRRAQRLIESLHPDLVHTTLFEADVIGRLASRLSNTPVVTSLVNESYGRGSKRDPSLRPWKATAARIVDEKTARFATRFHSISATVADVVSRELRIPRERIDVVHRGRDSDSLGTRTVTRRQAVRRSLGIDVHTPLLLAAGRQEHQKGFDVLVSAFERLREDFPQPRLFIAGRPGRATESLRRSSAIASGAAVLLGHRTDIPDLLVAADLFVFPSRWEGFGGVLVEAMALETPIVASDIAVVREVVDDSAHLAPVDNDEALATRIICAMGQDNTEMVHRARARFLERFNIEHAAAGMMNFYHRALRTTWDGAKTDVDTPDLSTPSRGVNQL